MQCVYENEMIGEESKNALNLLSIHNLPFQSAYLPALSLNTARLFTVPFS
jgi:hypothetical protein